MLLAAACAPGPAPADLLGLGGSFDIEDGGWEVRVLKPTPRLSLDSDAGCLRASGETVSADTILPALAMNESWVMVDEKLSCVARADVEELRHPASTPLHGATVQRRTPHQTFGADGCLTDVGGFDGGERVDARGWAHDGQYRGQVVVDEQLTTAKLRHVDIDGVDWPWHSGVMLIRPIDGGYVFGAGVVVGPRAILTVKHVGVDSITCYGREAHAVDAWYGGRFVCGNVDRVVDHPQIDAAIIVLKDPTPPPYARIRRTTLSSGDPIYSSLWSWKTWTELGDSTVVSVGSTNALCQIWPSASSFTLADKILQAGDSGGPSYSGDELVGLVHGGECVAPGVPDHHVMVHVPFLTYFIDPFL